MFTACFLTICTSIRIVSSAPHFVYLLVDDLGYGDVENNDAIYSTPNIDALRTDGIELTRFYVEPRCTPSRGALMTGVYPHSIGTANVFQAGYDSALPADSILLPQRLKQAGYTTRMLGKWHLGYLSWSYTPVNRGFDSFLGIFQSAASYYDHSVTYTYSGTDYTGYDFWQNDTFYNTSGLPTNDTYATKMYGDEAVSIINNHDTNNPLFLYVAFQAIHRAYEDPPTTYSECDSITVADMKTYCNQMIYLDNVIGDIRTALEDNNMWDDTYMIISTDNGGLTTEGGGVGSNFPFRGSKGGVFEGGIHGICYVSGGQVSSSLRGTTDESVFHIMDWHTTITDLGVGSVPHSLDGVSQSCILDGSCTNSGPRYQDGEVLFVQLQESNTGGIKGAALYVEDGNAGIKVWKVVKGNQRTYQYSRHVVGSPTASPTEAPTVTGGSEPYFNSSEKAFLFELTSDPTESDDVQDDNPKRFLRLVKAMEAETLADSIQNAATWYDSAIPSANGDVWSPIAELDSVTLSPTTAYPTGAPTVTPPVARYEGYEKYVEDDDDDVANDDGSKREVSRRNFAVESRRGTTGNFEQHWQFIVGGLSGLVFLILVLAYVFYRVGGDYKEWRHVHKDEFECVVGKDVVANERVPLL